MAAQLVRKTIAVENEISGALEGPDPSEKFRDVVPRNSGIGN